ncbi:MAG: TlpA disulfide reductase family protein [Candidatus Omnitrophota bacterium]|jgi:cytochrome c biogenesis protein CcmG/thiol:disulfide interchange protein DsbE
MKKIQMVILGTLALLVAGFVLSGQPALCKGAGPVKKAPEFSLKDINGKQVSLSDFKGKVLIIDFWATWCPPCKQEVPHFIELYDQYKDKGLEIIGIALDWQGEKVVPKFVSEYKINYPVVLGNDEVSGLYGGIAAIPTTFLVDREGNIIKKYIGYNAKEVFEKDMKELL